MLANSPLAHRACATRTTSEHFSADSTSSIACVRSHSSGNKTALKTSASAPKKLRRSSPADIPQRERRDRRRQIQSTLRRLHQRLQRTADADSAAPNAQRRAAAANQPAADRNRHAANGERRFGCAAARDRENVEEEISAATITYKECRSEQEAVATGQYADGKARRYRSGF